MGRSRPKTLIEVDGTPLAARLIAQLSSVVSQVVMVLSPWDEITEGKIGSEVSGVAVHYARQPFPIGLWDAVRRARGTVSGTFVLAMGDAFFDPSPSPCIADALADGADGAVLVERLDLRVREPIGVAEIDGDRVLRLAKRLPEPGWTRRVAGMAILPESALEHPAGAAAAEWEDVATVMIAEGTTFRAIEYTGWRRNVNTEDDVRAVLEHMEARRRPGVVAESGTGP